ncbi:MAG: hypothetical protein ABII12_00780 [Planctomycetota bacterium]
MKRTAWSIVFALAAVGPVRQEARADFIRFEFLYEFGEFCG